MVEILVCVTSYVSTDGLALAAIALSAKRFVLHDEAGHAARLVSWCPDQSDFSGRIRTDLRTIRELDDDGVHGCTDRGVRKFRSSCRSLRDGCVNHDGSDDNTALPCDASSVALVALSVRRRHGYLVGSRSCLLLGKPSEDIRGRLDPTDIRRPHVHHHDHLALRG